MPSLVGSEMCIRDRCSNSPVGWRHCRDSCPLEGRRATLTSNVSSGTVGSFGPKNVRRHSLSLKNIWQARRCCASHRRAPLRLYFAVTERAVSSVLVQEQEQVQRPIYFVSKVLQGPEVRYQALQKAALAVVFSARRLRHYFHSLTVVVMTDLPIQKVLKKPDVACLLYTSPSPRD